MVLGKRRISQIFAWFNILATSLHYCDLSYANFGLSDYFISLVQFFGQKKPKNCTNEIAQNSHKANCSNEIWLMLLFSRPQSRIRQGPSVTLFGWQNTLQSCFFFNNSFSTILFGHVFLDDYVSMILFGWFFFKILNPLFPLDIFFPILFLWIFFFPILFQWFFYDKSFATSPYRQYFFDNSFMMIPFW